SLLSHRHFLENSLHIVPSVTYFISYYHTSDILIYTKALLFAKVNKKVNSFLFVHKDIIFAIGSYEKSVIYWK
ncbi:hypothetical protein, partial [Parabacteroides distasonis]|uniref:hypothetical protein n=1 Tax=Parabacteroides distasonis TaxID=823 RepID=UPI001E574371